MLDEDGNEVGDDDFRISHMGPNGGVSTHAFVPAVAYAPSKQEYVVVWLGDDVDDEYEIYGQRLDCDGDQVGQDDFRLSDMGPDGDTRFKAAAPALASVVDGNELLVVWYGDDDEGELIDDEYEIFGQRYEIPALNYVYLPFVQRE